MRSTLTISAIDELKSELTTLKSLQKERRDVCSTTDAIYATRNLASLIGNEKVERLADIGTGMSMLYDAGLQIAEIASMNKVTELAKLAPAASSTASAFSSLSALSPISPLATAITAATCIIRGFRRKKRQRDPSIDAIIQCTQIVLDRIDVVLDQIVHLGSVVRDYFGVSFENDRIILDNQREGFSHLIYANAELKERMEVLAERADTHLERLESLTDYGFKYVSLNQGYYPLLAKVDAVLSGRLTQVPAYKIQSMAEKLASWVQCGGYASDAMYTGAKWAIDIHTSGQLNSVINKVSKSGRMGDLSELSGFLAFYARNIAGIPLPDSLMKSVFNEKLWINMADRYINLCESYSEVTLDPDNKTLRSIITAAENQLRFREALRGTSIVADTLIEHCKNALNDIYGLFSAAMKKQSEILTEEVRKRSANCKGVIIDITEPTASLQRYRRILPIDKIIKGGSPYTWYQDNYVWPEMYGTQIPDTPKPVVGNVSDIKSYSEYIDHKLLDDNKYPFPFVALESLGLGELRHDHTCQYGVRTHNSQPHFTTFCQVNTHFTYDGKSTFTVSKLNLNAPRAGVTMTKKLAYPDRIEELMKNAEEIFTQYLHERYQRAINEFLHQEPFKSQLEVSVQALNAHFSMMIIHMLYLGCTDNDITLVTKMMGQAANIVPYMADPSHNMQQINAYLADLLQSMNQFRTDIHQRINDRNMKYGESAQYIKIRELLGLLKCMLAEREHLAITSKTTSISGQLLVKECNPTTANLTDIIQRQQGIIEAQHSMLRDALSQLNESRQLLTALKSGIAFFGTSDEVNVVDAKVKITDLKPH